MKDLLLWTRVIVRTLNREFKNLRRQLQRKRHIKIELCVWLRALRLIHVRHVHKIGEVYFHLIGTAGFHARGKELKVYCCGLVLLSEPQK